MPPETNIPFWRKYFSVEVVAFFYFYGFLMYIPIGGIYVYQRVSDMKGFPYWNISQGADGSGCGGDDLGENSTLWELEQEVQTLSSQIGVVYNLFLSIPSLLVAPLWGPWTDRGGKRKPSLLVAIIGACLEMASVLVVMHFELSVYFLYVSAAISGFSGFALVLMVGATSYVADISSQEERAFRIAVLYLAIFFAGVISQLTSGLWIEYVGFIPAIWFILACYVLSGIWALFCVREIPKPTNNESAVRFFSLENIMCFFKLFRKRSEAGKKNLILLMVCGGLVFLSTVGIDGVKSLYILKSPLCWSPTLIGYYFAFEAFVHGIGSVVGIPLFGRCFKELNVARVGMVTIILASVLLAFSDRTWMVFVGAVVGVFNALADPVLMARMSSIVSKDEQGALFSAFNMVSTVMQLVGAVLFNTVYQATLGLTFQGSVFILCAVLVLIPFALVSWIKLSPVASDDTKEDGLELEKRHGQKQAQDTPREELRL
ncbi:proton-coupled folate transporter-like [Oculina patagonica]